MKKTTLALAMGLMISGAANAALEANIGATSNYLWRGVTQSSDDGAISGGLDYSHDSGAYIGTWISSLGNAAANTEMDYYAGFSGETASGIGYDLGYIYY
ncbi:MAG: TorF family putative porin, partial [Sedimenticolaceae bacterium]